MIEVDIPGRAPLRLAHVVLDVNGTLAVDGRLVPGVAEQLAFLGQQVDIHLLTADTYGYQAAINLELGLQAHITQHGGPEKGSYVLSLGADQVAVIGNGANDVAMFNAAALRIAVLEGEGLYAALLKNADVLVRDIRDALDLLLKPQRLAATLGR